MPVIYRAECSEHSQKLELRNWEMDGDGDVTVDVEPCPKCIEEAVEEAKSETVSEWEQKESDAYERGLAEGREEGGE